MLVQRNGVIALVLVILAGCADPAVWSAVAPKYQNGVQVSRMAIDVQDMPEPSRSW